MKHQASDRILIEFFLTLFIHLLGVHIKNFSNTFSDRCVGWIFVIVILVRTPMYAQVHLHKQFSHLCTIFHLTNQSRYIKICKAAALQCDSKAAAVSVTAATELLGGNKFLLGLTFLRFFFPIGKWKGMIVTV